MTNDEKKELLERLEAWAGCYRGYSWRNEDDLILDKLRALIAAPPPKHTMCENCLDDLEDYVWVYCDKCWQALCTEANQLIVKNRELKKSRPKVDEKVVEDWEQVIWAWRGDKGDGVALRNVLTDMLKEAGVEISPDNNSDKVSGKEKPR